MNDYATYLRAYICLGALGILFLFFPVRIAAQSQVDPQAILKAHDAWLKLSSPDVFLKAKEVSRSGIEVQYHLFATGLPADATYQVISWPVTDAAPKVVFEGVSIGKDGVVMCAGRSDEQCGDRKKPDDPIEFVFQPTKGEPYRLELASSNAKAAIVIVPDPIQGKDKGCEISVIRLTPGFELAFVTGTGFAPMSTVSIENQSYNEKHPLTAKTDSAGNLRFAMLPFIAGHTKGTTTVKAAGGTCTPSAKFDWGK